MDAIKGLIVKIFADHIRRLADPKFWAAIILITVAPLVLKKAGLTDDQFQLAMTGIGYVAVRLGIAMPQSVVPPPGSLEPPK